MFDKHFDSVITTVLVQYSTVGLRGCVGLDFDGARKALVHYVVKTYSTCTYCVPRV